jgi:hypothetical protein
MVKHCSPGLATLPNVSWNVSITSRTQEYACSQDGNGRCRVELFSHPVQVTIVFVTIGEATSVTCCMADTKLKVQTSRIPCDEEHVPPRIDV